MGGENTLLDRPAARHLLRRSGFGASEKVVKRWLDRGFTRGDAANELVAFRPNSFKPGGRDQLRQHNAWVKYMTRARSGLNEKLTLFWHDHFATGFSKVFDVKLMGKQNQLIRKGCKGSMIELVKSINRDPAMMEWLDTQRNRKAQPNENYGRELMELFTLGVFDLQGNRNYSDQQDVFQAARAFTGHRYDGRTAKWYFNDGQHDFTKDWDGVPPSEPNRGPKVLFAADAEHPGGFGGFGPGGVSYAPTQSDEGPQEIDRLTEILFEHTDGAGRKTVARRTARRLWEFFAHGGFDEPDAGLVQVVDDVISESSFDTEWNVGELVREIFVHDEFYASLADPTKKSVKWPVDFVVSTMRTLGVKFIGSFTVVPGGPYASVFDHLENMGQTVLDPPSVFGWNWESAWISSQTLLARYLFAENVASAEGVGAMKPSKLVDLELTDPGDIVDAVTDLLCVKDDLSSAERDVLVAYLGGPLDLEDYVQRRRKLYGLIGLVLQSPAYQMH
jgi:uncharacterized protein (DUF1800 family)